MTPRKFEYILYLDEKQTTCFPKSTDKRISKCQSRFAAIELYSKCCMPYKKSSTEYEYRITECCQCLEWYHVYIYIYIYMYMYIYIIYIYICICIYYIYIYIYIYTCDTCISGFELSFQKWPAKTKWVFPTARVYGGCKLTHWTFWAKMLSKCKKIVHRLTIFGIRYKQIVELEV